MEPEMITHFSWNWDEKKWEGTRKRGEFRYVLLNGVLLFGGALFLFNLLFDIADHRQLRPSSAFSAAWWILTGALLGDWKWISSERRFLRDRARRAVAADR
jgi:hypothetical protein